MKNEITTTVKTTQKVVFDLREEPVIEKWPGVTNRGKPVQLDTMHFIIEQFDDEEPKVGRLHVWGWLVKKDGTVSRTTAPETQLWGDWVNPDSTSLYYEREAEVFAHLIEAARKVARVVLAG